ncbi:hypothetical protein GF395_04265 [Candidatus Uhrbacteria bacterium]|nr:hypothetical protein [Candidatus Uhrbacteria bacterium]
MFGFKMAEGIVKNDKDTQDIKEAKPNTNVLEVQNVPKEFSLFTKEGINNIKQVPILKPDEIRQLEEKAKSIQKAFESKQVYRTDTEARVSVLNDLKFPTADAKYWQSVREEDVHFSELVRLSFDYKRVQIEVDQLERDIVNENKKDDKFDDDLYKKKLKVDLEEKAFQLKQMQIVAHHRFREITQWEQIREEILKGNPNIDINDPNTHQLYSYAHRFTNQYLSAVKSKAKSPSEMINIKGLLFTLINRVGKKTYMNKILNHYNRQDQNIIKNHIN